MVYESTVLPKHVRLYLFPMIRVLRHKKMLRETYIETCSSIKKNISKIDFHGISSFSTDYKNGVGFFNIHQDFVFILNQEGL